MINIYIGGVVNGGVCMRNYAADASIKWGYYVNGTCNGLAVDPTTGRVALAVGVSGNQIYVLNSSGQLLWNYSHHATQVARAVCFDSAGNLIVGADATTSSPYYTVRKLDPDGNLLWSVTPGGNSCYSVAVDSQDNVIAAGNGGGAGTYVRKYSPEGTLLYSYNHGTSIYGVAVDSQDNVIIAGTRYSFSVTTRKLDSTLTWQWDADHGNGVYAVAVDLFDNIITGGIVSSGVTTRKYNSSGTEQWNKNHGADVRAVTCDKAGNVYTTGITYSSLTTHRYAGDGTNTNFVNFGSNTYSIATLNESIPSIPLGVSFGSILPLREISPQSLLTGFIIYRCYLTGGTGTIEIPISSFQSRRRTDTPVWLSVVSPAATDAMVTDINARSAGQIIIKRGVKYPDGSEQLDELMRADFESLRIDKGATSASLSLTGRSTETSTAKTRVLQGISYRPTNDGTRRVRCAVDTYLAPGDTADLGGAETMPVNEVVIWVSPQQAYMEAAEA